MAKVKNKKMTIDDALLPVKDQPFEALDNWRWVKIGYVANVFTGNSINERIKKEKYEGKTEGLLFIATKDVEFDNTINYETNIRITDPENFKKAPKNTALLCIEGGSAGRKIGFTNQEVCFGNKLCAFATERIDSKYIFYFLQSNLFMNQFNEKKHGLIGGVSVGDLAEIAIPIPPFSEQQRIVEQIEKLFSKLDEAKEKAQEALDSFEERRVAILHKAFEGKLTDQWRKKRGIDLSSWRNVPLKDCGRWFGGGTPTTSKKEFWEGGDIPWITSKDMKDRLIEDSLMHITMVGVENSSANYCEEPAVLFVMRSGILRRVFPVCMVKRPFTVNQDLKACVPNGILQEYLYWYCTGFEKDIRDNCMKNGTTVESVEAKKLFDYSIRVAGADEQKEIVDRIEEMLDKEAAAYEAAEEVIENIEMVKKSILAKAFRGELGTNDPSEENSIVLLKQAVEKG